MNDLSYGWLSILPPLLAIGLAIVTRQVFVSLLAGIAIGWLIVAEWNVFAGAALTIDALIGVFGEAWQTRVIIFTLLMGSLLAIIRQSGGVYGFVDTVSRWRWARSRVGAQLMTWVLGLGIFMESTITVLVAGTVSRPIYDKLKISREKLAYICDSTSAPVCMLIPFNGWGALVLVLLGGQAAFLGGEAPLVIFGQAILLNFYAILAVLLVLVLCLTGRDFGPMKRAEARARDMDPGAAKPGGELEVSAALPQSGEPRLRNMLVPMLVLLAMTPAGIAITGWRGVVRAEIENPTWVEYLRNASGTEAVLWAVCLALLVAVLLTVWQRVFSVKTATDTVLHGAGEMLPMATIMALAFGIGMTCTALNTGEWVADAVTPYLTPALLAPVVFLTACFMAFSTGTSWGTMAIMIPLAVPLAAGFADAGEPASLALVVSAVLGGAVFGDHCSPISDTTVISSLAAGCDHIEHVRTQIPYALLAGAIATLLYLLVGLVV